MKIFSVALNLHDHNTYNGIFHNQLERFTREKHNLSNTSDFIKNYFKKYDNTILAFTYTVGGVKNHKELITKEILNYNPKKLFDYYFKDNIYYIDHHQSHATYTFINSGFEQSDILSIDGIGSKYRCVFFDKEQNLIDLSDKLPIGWLWNHMSNLVGFGTLGASKLMGKVGYGKYNDYYYNVFEIICSGVIEEKKYKEWSQIKINKYGIDDLAYTLQKFTIDKLKQYVYPLKSCNNICLAGGVAYNGYMNEEFTNHYDNVYVPPAIGDEGQSLGTYQHADYILNNNKHTTNTFAGIDYDYKGKEKVNITEVAQSIANGKIVGWFQGKSESGNRALGNRSILADPRNPNIKDIINQTIKKREDFRPFAPSVLEEYYAEYFDTKYTSPYMSRIVKVKSDKVPGITHIDNTARIQTVNKNFNEKFYNLIYEFYKITGVPMLLNTSFNCQEPIVETPEDAIKTFSRTDLDLLVINDYIIRK
jgi:carbamoyltransferase